MSSNQAPQLDRGEMTAAENANIRAAEEIMRLLARSLREHADQYPPKLRKSLSDPKAETSIEVSFNGESVYSANLDKDQRHKEPPVNRMDHMQANFLKEALLKQKGESLEHPDIKNMRVFVDGHKLYELKDGKVIQNDLPLEFSKSLNDMIKPRPLDLAVNNFTQNLRESLAKPMPEPELATPQNTAEVRKSAIASEPTQQNETEAKTPSPQPSPSTETERSQPAPVSSPTPRVEKAPQPAPTPEVPRPDQKKAAPTQSAPTTTQTNRSPESPQASRPPTQPEPTSKQAQTSTVEKPKAPAVESPLPEQPKATAAQTPQPTQTTTPNPVQDNSLPRGYIPDDFGIGAARGITPEKVQATGDMTLMLGFAQLQNLKYELNDAYNRANAPGFEYIRQNKEVADFEAQFAQLKPAFEARLKDLTEQGKYTAPPSAAQSTPAQAPTAQPQASPTPGKNIPGLDQSLSNGEWVPAANQDELNRNLIAKAREAINLGCAEEPRGNRVLDSRKYTIYETSDSLSVFLKDTDKTIEQKGNTITGQARQADIDMINKGSLAMKQLNAKMEKSAEMEMGD